MHRRGGGLKREDASQILFFSGSYLPVEFTSTTCTVVCTALFVASEILFIFKKHYGFLSYFRAVPPATHQNRAFKNITYSLLFHSPIYPFNLFNHPFPSLHPPPRLPPSSSRTKTKKPWVFPHLRSPARIPHRGDPSTNTIDM